jgi:hypothetical protein
MNTTDIQALANKVSEGLASQEDTGVLLKSLQISMGTQIVQNLGVVAQDMSNLSDMVHSAVSHLITKFKEAVECDTIELDDLLKVINTLQKNQVSFVDLQRKIVQSPNKLFPEETVSTEERQLLEIVKSFSTAEEKKQFFNAVEKAYQETKSNEFTEAQ